MVDVVIIRQRMGGMSDEDLANLVILEWSLLKRDKSRQALVFELEKADPEKINRVLRIIADSKSCSCRMASLAYDLLEANLPGVY